MPRIELQTEIKACKEVVFDLSRSIDFHKLSTRQTKETVIAGKTSGLMELNETVTWRAKHYGLYQKLTSKITEFDRPHYFADEMVTGAFRSFKHEHYFNEVDRGTLMTDIFDYTSPFGILGKLADIVFLKKYMMRFLVKRNEIIKEFAESGKMENFYK
ncbi:MAG: SRPBCC family protein [Flavobacteriales bacterium]|nr:SRPBCC family protein [Flavobacteriales bacterium]